MSKKAKEFNIGVQAYIMQGSRAEKHEVNPYSAKGSPKRFHAWSAGHFDKWGRV